MRITTLTAQSALAERRAQVFPRQGHTSVHSSIDATTSFYCLHVYANDAVRSTQANSDGARRHAWLLYGNGNRAEEKAHRLNRDLHTET